MENRLLNEIIQLKEEKKLYEAVCGNREIDRHIFNKHEQERMRNLRRDSRVEITLENVSRNLEEDEKTFRQEHH